MNVNFAVTKLLALAPHGSDKHRLEGATDLSPKISFYVIYFQMISDSFLLKLKAG